MRASGSRADGWPVGVSVFTGLTIKIAFMVSARADDKVCHVKKCQF